MSKPTTANARQRPNGQRSGKATDKYRLMIKPVRYTGRKAEFNAEDKYEEGPLLPFYINDDAKAWRFPEQIVPAVYAELYYNVHSGHGKYNDPPIAIYTTKNGWNNDVASFKKVTKDEPSEAND